MSKMWWFWALLFIATCVFIALLPAIGNSTPSYKLYIYNMDNKNYYAVRIKNEDTGWQANLNIEAGSCETVYRMEPGEYSIRTYKDGGWVGDYAGFEITDDDLCIEITSAIGTLDICESTFCD